jgi:hypothetical protein
MGLVRVTPTSSDVTLQQYPASAAKPDTFYQLTLLGEQPGPYTVTRREPDGKVSFLLQPPLTADHIQWVTEFPPLKRVEATDGAFIDNPTPLQAFEFLHHHVTANITIVV